MVKNDGTRADSIMVVLRRGAPVYSLFRQSVGTPEPPADPDGFDGV